MDVAEALHSRVDHLLRGWQAGQVVNEWLGQEPEQVLARQEKWGFSIPRSATLLHSTLSLIYTNQNLEELKRRRKVASVGAGVWLWGPIPELPGLSPPQDCPVPERRPLLLVCGCRWQRSAGQQAARPACGL